MKKIIAGLIIGLAFLTAGILYIYPEFTTVTFTRSGGALADNPVYSLKITGDGKVTYIGNKAKVVGKKEANIGSQKARQLITEFMRIKPFSLENKYIAPTVSEVPKVKISLQILFLKKDIEYDEITAPEALTELGEKIDKITNSQQWVYPGSTGF